MELKEIMRELAKRGIDTYIKYSSEYDQLFLHNGSESPLISFAVGGMKATQYKANNYFK